MKSLEKPATTVDSTWDDSHAIIHMEYEALSDEQGINAINQELVKAMISHLSGDPNQSWKLCHHAPTFLYLKRTLPEAKWNYSKIKSALWLQTKATRFGMMMDADDWGYNPRQAFRPLPNI